MVNLTSHITSPWRLPSLSSAMVTPFSNNPLMIDTMTPAFRELEESLVKHGRFTKDDSLVKWLAKKARVRPEIILLTDRVEYVDDDDEKEDVEEEDAEKEEQGEDYY